MSTPVHLSKRAPVIEPIYLGLHVPFHSEVVCQQQFRIAGCEIRQHISKTRVMHLMQIGAWKSLGVRRDSNHGLTSERSSTELAGPGTCSFYVYLNFKPKDFNA